jgi:ubiquinone/menaquinone biosynthesis C-methylase UbiE
VILTENGIVDLYRKRARNYDLTVQLYYLLGFRLSAYRRRAITSLKLRTGAAVVDIACGTGANFPFLQQAIGPRGKIIGVDLTDAMLAQARRRVEEKGWLNVELIQSDAASYDFPTNVDGIISSFAITLVPEFDAVIQNGRRSLSTNGRFVVLDFKVPSGWLSRLAPLGVFLTRPFGVSMELASRHPWESIAAHFGNVCVEEFYGGFVYVAVGEQRDVPTSL